MKENSNKYSPLKIQQLKMWLEEMREKQQPKFFEVFVDDFKVIPKTDVIDDFDKHEQYMDEESRKITVLIYNTPNSNRYRQHIFLLNEKPQAMQQSQTLSGPEVQMKIEEALRHERERNECEKVKEKLQDKINELEEAEEYIDKLKGIIRSTEMRLQDAKSMNDITALLKEFALPLLPIKKVPNDNLSGAQPEKKPEEQASFSKNGESVNSEVLKPYAEAAKMLVEKFTEEEMDTVLEIIYVLGENKNDIKPVAELLNINHKKTKTNEKI